MLEDKFSRYSLIGIFAAMILVTLFTFFFIIDREVTDRNSLAETKLEDEALFGKYNDDYEPKVTSEKDGRLVVVDIDAQKYGGRGNKALVNYISNVGGKLLSVNGVDVKGSSGSSIPFVIPGTPNMGMLRMRREEEKKRNVFVILVPKDAPAVNNLEERIELYARYAK